MPSSPPDSPCRPRDFHAELEFFRDKIQNREPFAFSRWGDGELTIIRNRRLGLRKTNCEYSFDPRDPAHIESRQRLIRALRYQDSRYYVGLPCPCCVGHRRHRQIKRFCGHPEVTLTWANLFVNANHDRFLESYLPAFARQKIILVANDRCQLERLPFAVEQFHPVSGNAWLHNLDLVDHLLRCIRDQRIAGRVFIFAAGPLANVAVHELWATHPENSYIDVGSALDVSMGLPATRRYQRNLESRRLTCVWDSPPPNRQSPWAWLRRKSASLL